MRDAPPDLKSIVVRGPKSRGKTSPPGGRRSGQGSPRPLESGCGPDSAPADPPTAASLNAITRAARSACLNASAVEISGAGASLRTAIPIEVRAMSFRLPGTIEPSCSILAIAGAPRMRISAPSPAASFACNAPTVANVMSSSLPLARVNLPASALTAVVIERAHMILSVMLSIRLDAGFLDRCGPFHQLRLDEIGEVLRPTPEHFRASGVQAFDHRRSRQRLLHGIGEHLHDLGRQVRRAEHAGPGQNVETRHDRLAQRRHIRQDPVALLG